MIVIVVVVFIVVSVVVAAAVIIIIIFYLGTLDPSGFTKIIRRFKKMCSGIAKTRQDPAA